MFRFKGFIFNEFFTAFDKRSDPNKDLEGKGTQERFQEIFEDEYDENILPLIEELQLNIYEPQAMKDRYVPYAESMMGYLPDEWPWLANLPLPMRRNVLDVMPKLYEIRGTRLAYQYMFAWIGITAVVEEIDPIGGHFDLPDHTWDMPGRTFDADCPACSSYRLILSGPNAELTPDEIEALETIIAFNEPINARLEGIVYNALDLMGDFNNDFGILVGEDFY